mmetsp:Transcript_36854/g.98146  ORF Transcript_36854/g.98146 Transcript_36854/m.98146 type:complete len:185 (-) Transcript_36854:310-864(-)
MQWRRDVTFLTSTRQKFFRQGVHDGGRTPQRRTCAGTSERLFRHSVQDGSLMVLWPLAARAHEVASLHWCLGPGDETQLRVWVGYPMTWLPAQGEGRLALCVPRWISNFLVCRPSSDLDPEERFRSQRDAASTRIHSAHVEGRCWLVTRARCRGAERKLVTRRHEGHQGLVASSSNVCDAVGHE